MAGITEQDISDAASYETLGPAYFTSRRIAESVMAGVDTEPLKAIATRVTDQVQTAVYEYVEDHMRSDLESNLQGYLTDMLDSTVKALLTGEEWAMKRYPLSSRYDALEVRAACAKHGGEPLLMARIADLEKRTAELSESLRLCRDRY